MDTDAPTPFSFNMDEMSDDDDDGKIKINSILEKPSVFTNFFIFRVQLLRFHAKNTTAFCLVGIQISFCSMRTVFWSPENRTKPGTALTWKSLYFLNLALLYKE